MYRFGLNTTVMTGDFTVIQGSTDNVFTYQILQTVTTEYISERQADSIVSDRNRESELVALSGSSGFSSTRARIT